MYKVSVASVVKWSQRFRATGSAAARRMGGYRPRSLAGEREWLLARLAAAPDLTLRALVVELWRTRRGDELRIGLAHGPPCGHQLQKKLCSPPSRIVPTWREGVDGGRRIKTGSTRRA